MVVSSEWRLLGETYLHGFMNGEVFRDEYEWKEKVGEVRIV
jgi:hypothetical protein